MVPALQALPLLLLAGLLLTGAAGPLAACLVALAAAVPAAAVSLPAGASLPGVLLDETGRALFLGLQPVAVVAGGLLFHAATEAGPRAPAAGPPDAGRVFDATLLGGAFLESVTGFGVGAVFALASLRAQGLGQGLGGAAAGALALRALALVPWGGLGPGTALGAALAGLPAQEVAQVAAWPAAGLLLALAPLGWRLSAAAGVPVPAAERRAQLGLAAAMALLLLAANRLLPWELAGIAATAPPLLWRLWRRDPPRGAAAWARAARAVLPYALLTAALLASRLVPDPPSWRPYPALPALPLTHVAAVLWAVSALLLARRADGMARARAALGRAGRPALAMLLYVLLARWLAGGGAAAGLALALADGLGALAPLAIPPLGVLAGIVTGSNVGANAALMPVQEGLGRAAGLAPALAPGLHVFLGGAGAALSFAGTAMVCGLLADGTRPAALWRHLWPMLAAALALGWLGLGLPA